MVRVIPESLQGAGQLVDDGVLEARSEEVVSENPGLGETVDGGQAAGAVFSAIAGAEVVVAKRFSIVCRRVSVELATWSLCLHPASAATDIVCL